MSGNSRTTGRKRPRRANLDIDATAALGGTQPDPTPSHAPRQDVWGPDYSQMPADSIVHKKDPFGREKYQKDLREYRRIYPIRGLSREEWPILRPERVSDDGSVRVCCENPFIWPSELRLMKQTDEQIESDEETVLNSDAETVLNSDGEEAAVEECVSALMTLKNSVAPICIEPEDLEAAKSLLSMKHKRDDPEKRRPGKRLKKASVQPSTCNSRKPSRTRHDSARVDSDMEYEPERLKATATKRRRKTASSRSLVKAKPTSEQGGSLDSSIPPEQDLNINFRKSEDWLDEELDMLLKLRDDLKWRPWAAALQVLGRSDVACRIQRWKTGKAEKKARKEAEEEAHEPSDKKSVRPFQRLQPWSYEDEQLLKRLIDGGAGKTWTFEEIAGGNILSQPRSVLACQLQYRYVIHPKYQGRPSSTNLDQNAAVMSREPSSPVPDDGEEIWDPNPLL